MTDVLMPQLGETVSEGKITKWFKSAGDAVKPGDNLFEIETDKVSMEVPSIVAGTLSEIRVPAGEVAPVGAVVAVIAGEGAAASAPLPPPLVPAKAGTQLKSEPAALDSRLRGNERQTGRFEAARRAAVRAARSVLRSAHAGAQFRAGAAARRRHRDAAGAAAGGRGRDRSRPHGAVRPARPHRRARRRGGDGR